MTKSRLKAAAFNLLSHLHNEAAQACGLRCFFAAEMHRSVRELCKMLEKGASAGNVLVEVHSRAAETDGNAKKHKKRQGTVFTPRKSGGTAQDFPFGNSKAQI